VPDVNVLPRISVSFIICYHACCILGMLILCIDSFLLAYKAVPDVIPEVISQIAYEGDTALFTFQATGIPLPDVTWYFNSVPVDETNTMKYMISEMSFNPTAKNSTLTVLGLESSNMGTYTCNAVNSFSSKSGSGLLTINSKSSIYD